MARGRRRSSGVRQGPPVGQGTALVLGWQDYFRPFNGLAQPTRDTSVIRERPERVAFVLFTGGEDVGPHLYGEPIGSRTGCNRERDNDEVAVFHAAKAAGVPCVGICRGSQFLCVMNGGKLAQDITGHAVRSEHGIHTHDGRLVSVTSTHHQMQLPPAEARVLAYAEPRLSRHYLDGWDREIEPRPEYEYEGVWYPAGRSLGMQWHPEFMAEADDGFQYARRLVIDFVLR